MQTFAIAETGCRAFLYFDGPDEKLKPFAIERPVSKKELADPALIRASVERAVTGTRQLLEAHPHDVHVLLHEDPKRGAFLKLWFIPIHPAN